MSENKMATKEDLKEFYNRIYPYLGGSADAGFTPVGTIISVMSNHAPANYLICDGTVYNIADYPELANHFLNEFGSKNKFGGDGTTTFAVPNLLGEFLRMTGTNSHANQGNGANVGVHQNATVHEFISVGENGLFSEDRNSTRGNIDYVVSDLPTYNEFAATRLHQTGGGSWSGLNGTSRPTNTSVLYCIATKNIYLNPSLDYSTDEKIVGTWIDGKPIYQRTASFEMQASDFDNATYTATYIINNLKQPIDKFIYYNAMISVSDSSRVIIGVLPFIYLNAGGTLNAEIALYISNSSNGLIVNLRKNNATTLGDYIGTLIVTLQYTKTSD